MFLSLCATLIVLILTRTALVHDGGKYRLQGM